VAELRHGLRTGQFTFSTKLLKAIRLALNGSHEDRVKIYGSGQKYELIDGASIPCRPSWPAAVKPLSGKFGAKLCEPDF
jgi:hypothetical protein